MRHLLVTRAVYDPRLWPVDANRRRLNVAAAVTVASLAAQTCRDWEWHVALHPDDELLTARQETFTQAGVPCVWHPLPPEKPPRPGSRAQTNRHRVTRAKQAIAAYQTLGPFDGPTLTTRLDDDDAFTADAFTRLHAVVSEGDPETAWLFPTGHRVWGGRYTEVRYESNAMASLWSPRGRSVVSYRHRQVRAAVRRMRFVDEAPAWLWVRHDDTLSDWRVAYQPITDELRALYPIDWNLLDTQPLAGATVPRKDGRDWLP